LVNYTKENILKDLIPKIKAGQINKLSPSERETLINLSNTVLTLFIRSLPLYRKHNFELEDDKYLYRGYKAKYLNHIVSKIIPDELKNDILPYIKSVENNKQKLFDKFIEVVNKDLDMLSFKDLSFNPMSFTPIKDTAEKYGEILFKIRNTKNKKIKGFNISQFNIFYIDPKETLLYPTLLRYDQMKIVSKEIKKINNRKILELELEPV
jgi:hypothetical protein